LTDARWNQRYVGLESYMIRNGELAEPVLNPVLEFTTGWFYSNIVAKDRNLEFILAHVVKASRHRVFQSGLAVQMLDLENESRCIEMSELAYILLKTLQNKFDEVSVLIEEKNNVMVKLWNSEPSVTQSWLQTSIQLRLAKSRRLWILDYDSKDPTLHSEKQPRRS